MIPLWKLLRQEVESINMCDSIKDNLRQEVESNNMCDSIKNILRQEVDSDNKSNSIIKVFMYGMSLLSIYISPHFLACLAFAR